MTRTVQVFTKSGDEDGPTVLLTAGIHGDEPAGWRAANLLRENTEIKSGKVAFIPEVNKAAIDEGSHSYDKGNLNRHFPPFDRPKTRLARRVWEKVEEVDPDVHIDLHSSKGILTEDHDGLGQAVFHTPAAFRLSLTGLLERFNADVLVPSEYDHRYHFVRGITNGDSPMLYHKIASELHAPTYLVETTRKGTTIEDRVKWEAEIARRILGFHGVLQD